MNYSAVEYHIHTSIVYFYIIFMLISFSITSSLSYISPLHPRNDNSFLFIKVIQAPRQKSLVFKTIVDFDATRHVKLRLSSVSAMYLMYYLDEAGTRVYTLAKTDPKGNPTFSAHPARFSPEDQYSRQRITIKQRFNLLPTQQKPIKY